MCISFEEGGGVSPAEHIETRISNINHQACSTME